LTALPVIVGYGGINAAGRATFDFGYRRMVLETLPKAEADETLLDLAVLTGRLRFSEEAGYQDSASGQSVELDNWLQAERDSLLDNSLIRRLDNQLFDPDAVEVHQFMLAQGEDEQPVRFKLRARQLPQVIPANWQVEELADERGMVEVTIASHLPMLVSDYRTLGVTSAGQIPAGFNPSALYPSRNHPRGLQLTIFAASEALNSAGLDWASVMSQVSPDKVGVYASSAMSQLDENGNGGLLQSALKGKRVSSKQLPLGFNDMPADFVNAYVVGSIGGTGANVGACATFLYNLRLGMDDIRSGEKRIVIVGGAEAPITSEVMDGYRTMGALADDESLCKLDGVTEVDNRRACRPFSDNCGFTLAEGSQFVILMDDELALATGAHLYAGVGDVFVNADGFKKSISSPGVGNYITVAKAMASVRAILGEEALAKTFVQAHGTGTPQNRVTESDILNRTAEAFGIDRLPVVAIKSYIGHTLGVAAGDQIAVCLGFWQQGILPGIKSITHIAEDVQQSHLDFVLEDRQLGAEAMDAAVINAKGFGGNNASASLISPHRLKALLLQRHGVDALARHEAKHESVMKTSEAYRQQTLKGQWQMSYHFGENVREAQDVTLSGREIRIEGYQQAISLELVNPY